MATRNTRTRKSAKYDREHRTAGGHGMYAAKQDNESKLRRLVMANLLWEDLAYIDGESVTKSIQDLIPFVAPGAVAAIANEAANQQKLRHVPLLIAREMCRYDLHKQLVADLLPKIIRRPDQITEFFSLYFGSGDFHKSDQKLSKAAQKGLGVAFQRFDEYQLGKYKQEDKGIKLKDVLFLLHPTPLNEEQQKLWDRLVEGKLATPDTWEVKLSAGGDKKENWVAMLESGKMGALALIRNLRNMHQAGVDRKLIRKALHACKPAWLLPVNFFAAARHASDFTSDIEDLMYRCCAAQPKLPGWSIFVVDVSGSMNSGISGKSEFNRMEVASSMAVLAREMCEDVTIYATAGNDSSRIHKTKKIRPLRGFGLASEIGRDRLGGGGIFTRQCLEYIREEEHDDPDRIIIFSDSQDCDLAGAKTAKPFGKTNYIVDVSAHEHGVAYAGDGWTAEVSGWSEHFLKFIAAMEGAGNSQLQAQ